MLRSRPLRILTVVLLIILISALFWALRPAPRVVVVNPQRREVVELVIDSGVLRASLETDLGSEVTGVVDNVLVREGDRVTAGQVVMTLRREEAEERVQQARLAAETAQRQLEVASRGPLQSEVARARAELRQAQQQGSANLAAARQRFRELQRGGRPEEIQQAQAALNQARANREQTELDLQRSRFLLERGAVPQAEVDSARTALERARAAEQSAVQALALARQPASSEEIAAARAEVRAAEAALQGSVQTSRENLRTLLAQPRTEDVQVARARLEEARSAVRQAEEDLAKRTIRSPVSGLVTERTVEPGQSITPGADLLTVADMSRTEVFVETDEDNLPKLRVGQPATVVAPAFAERPFRAVLFRIGPDIDTERGVVGLRLRPSILPDYARPDMTVDVNIEVNRIPEAWSVPVSSVVRENGRDYILVIEDERVERRPVEILGRSTDYAAVRDLSPGLQVVLRGTEVNPGQKAEPAPMPR